MKFSIQQSELAKALNSVSRVVPSKGVHPILSCILLELSNQILSLTGFDLAVGIKTQVMVSNAEDGAIAVASKLFCDIISSLPNGELKIEVIEQEDGMQLSIKMGKRKYKIPCQDASDYPALPQPEPESQAIELECKALGEALRSTLFSASPDETKQVLTGLHFKPNNGFIEVASTDVHRLTVAYLKFHSEMPEVTIPRRALSEVERLIKDKEGVVQITLTDTQAVFQAGDTTLMSRTLVGDYPPYQQLLPDSFSKVLVIDRAELIDAVDRLVLLVTEKNSKIKAILTKKEVTITAMGLGNGEEIISDIEYSGEDIELILNAKYFLEGLKSFTSKEVQININEALLPITLVPLGSNTKVRHLVMPLRNTEA